MKRPRVENGYAGNGIMVATICGECGALYLGRWCSKCAERAAAALGAPATVEAFPELVARQTWPERVEQEGLPLAGRQEKLPL